MMLARFRIPTGDVMRAIRPQGYSALGSAVADVRCVSSWGCACLPEVEAAPLVTKA